MFDEINKIIKKRYTKDNYITIYDDNQIHITNAVHKILSKEPTVSAYSIDMNTVFKNADCEFSYLSIAYISDDQLEHETYIVEVH